jgi:class 3 adenylate cyclase
MLVGRETEHVLLERWLAEARAGQPRLVLITGEAGIGKTTLLEQWAMRADESNARVLMGSAFEHVMTPFLPVASALQELAGVGELFGDDVADLEHADLRAHLAVTRALFEAAARRPTVLAIDDVHWADPGTLGFLQHLVAAAAHRFGAPPVRLLLVLTARTNTGSASVDTTLRRLARESIARLLRLEGLGELQVHEMLAQRCGRMPSAQLVHSFLRATAGNPLLVEMLIEQLQDGSHFEMRANRLIATVDAESFVVSPELEEAWTVRLRKVRPATRRLLETAAFLGDGASLDELQMVVGRDEAEFSALLGDAELAGLVTIGGGAYRFCHPLLRRALMSAAPARRRRYVEAGIASALSKNVSDVGRVALAAVEHARRAGGFDFGADGAHLLEMAAHEAAARGAWATAAACYEQLLEAPATHDIRDHARVELSAGMAHRHNSDYQAAHPHLVAALDLAREIGELEIWGEALFWLTNAQVLERVPELRVPTEKIEQFLEAAGDEVPDARAMLLASLAQFHFSRFDLDAAVPALARAKSILADVRRVGTHHFVATVEGLHQFGNLDMERAERCFRTASSLSKDHEDPWQAVFIEVGLPLVDILAGQLDRAATEAAAAAESAVATSQWHLHGLASACCAAAAIGQGRIVEGERDAALAVQSFHRSDYYWAAAVGFSHLAAARAYRGDLLGGRQALQEWGDRGRPMVARHAMRVELLCGSPAEVDRLRETARLVPIAREPSLFTVNQAAVAVEVGDRLDDLRLVEAGFEHLRAVPPAIRFGIEWCVSVNRVAALAAIRLGDLEAAEQLLDRATDDVRRASSSIEEARVAAVRGRLLVERGASEQDVLQVLEPARAQVSASRLLAIDAEVRRVLPDSSWGRHRDLVVLYTDLVSSTELNVRAGDDFFVELLREHNRIVRERLAAFGGVEFTYTGDGVGARFTSDGDALRFALGLQADFDDANRRHPDFPLHVRIGLAKGDAIEEAGNLFGQTIVRAVRVCAAAGAGQVLGGEEIAESVDPSLARFQSVGSFALKGFAGRTDLYEARRPAAGDYRSSPAATEAGARRDITV